MIKPNLRTNDLRLAIKLWSEVLDTHLASEQVF